MRTLILITKLSILTFVILLYSCSDSVNHDNFVQGPVSLDNPAPCCNNHDPRTTTSSTFYVYCSGGEILIDSQCCANLWNYFGGPPPPSLNCTSIYTQCPEPKGVVKEGLLFDGSAEKKGGFQNEK